MKEKKPINIERIREDQFFDEVVLKIESINHDNMFDDNIEYTGLYTKRDYKKYYLFKQNDNYYYVLDTKLVEKMTHTYSDEPYLGEISINNPVNIFNEYCLSFDDYMDLRENLGNIHIDEKRKFKFTDGEHIYKNDEELDMIVNKYKEQKGRRK